MTSREACEFDTYCLEQEINCIMEYPLEVLKENERDLKKCAAELNKLLERISE